MSKTNGLFEIYLHRCRLNGKGYVGLTCRGWRARLYAHESLARNGSSLPFHRAIRKHGMANFETTILATATELEAAQAMEKEWISVLGTFGKGGYNSTVGGEGTVGYVPTPERRKAISEQMRGVKFTEERKQRIAEAQRGRPKKPEHIERAAAARRGKKQSPAVAAKSRASAGKALSTWVEMAATGEAKRRQRIGKAKLINIHWPDGRLTLERTTYIELSEKHGIARQSVWNAIRYRSVIRKECGLRGCRISLFTESAMSMAEYKAALCDPKGAFS